MTNPLSPLPSQTMKTHVQYLAGEISHHAYYSQFVTDSVKSVLLNRIPLEKLNASRDPHFNDIPLKEWDTIKLPHSAEKLLLQAGHAGISLSDSVCVFKAAAKILIGE